MSLYCTLDELANESDVESKFLSPLFCRAAPEGFGFENSHIRTKPTIKSYSIGKNKRKSHVPDFILSIKGQPVIVVEAKAPHKDLYEAFSEARLYASEINAKSNHSINQCNRIIVSNGKETWAGFYDQDKPVIKLTHSDFSIENIKFNELLEFCSIDKITKQLNDTLYFDIYKSIYVSPVSTLGGKRAQNESLVENQYGRTLVYDFGHIFNPQTEADIANVVNNAYIPSKKREQHMDPFYREIKKTKLPFQSKSTLISTQKPDEITSIINSKSNEKPGTPAKNSLILLIGTVGSGKSTFIRYFKETYFKKHYPEINKKCDWIFLDLNSVIVNANEIYEYIRNEIISKIKKCNPKINFETKEIIDAIFKDDIDDFKSGMGAYISDNKTLFDSELFKKITVLRNDSEMYLQRLIKYVKRIVQKTPIIVLDNCDKRTREEQLLMFQVAEWIKSNYNCLVILPMRDITYDLYKLNPPLDTVVQDLVFRIDPADLLSILQSRLEYIIRSQGDNDSSYTTSNGIKVKVNNDEQVEYLKGILTTIRNDPWAKRIFYSLSNRNTRVGIQLFMDFCRSGHIETEDFFKMRLADSSYSLPSSKIINALLRQNRKFYNDSNSNITNLFYSQKNETAPDPFSRIHILMWLNNRLNVKGPNSSKGFHKTNDMISDLSNIGHEISTIKRDIHALSKRGLIIKESLMHEIDLNELMKITQSGILHLDLLGNLSYLAACSEDVLYRNTQTTMDISKRIMSEDYLKGPYPILNANDMLLYLSKYQSLTLSEPDLFVNTSILSNLPTFDKSFACIDKAFNKSLVAKLYASITPGMTIECRVVNKNNYSVIAVYEEILRCFLATTQSKYSLSLQDYDTLNESSFIVGEVIDIDYHHNSIQLKFIKIKSENTD